MPRILHILLTLMVATWSGLAIATYNAPPNEDAADLEIRCRYGLCEDRDMAQLARYRSFQTGVAQDPALIRGLLAKAPASPELWCDYAEALRERGKDAEGGAAFLHAIDLAPNSPAVLLRAAAAHLVDFRPQDALPLFRRIFEKTPDYPGDNVFGLCARFGVAPEAMLKSVLPPGEPKPAAAYLRFLMRTAKGFADPANAWKWMVSHKLDTPPLASEYANYLLAQKQPEQAFAAWSAKREYARGNRIYNPGFEAESLGQDGPFDWRIDQIPGVASIGIDLIEPHSGSRCLEIRFLGQQNVAFQHVSQQIALSPGVYSFKAWIKTESLTTDRGVHLAVQDLTKGGFLWTSEPSFLGTEPWTLVTGQVAVPPGSPLVRVLLMRNLSTRIDSKIKGFVWLDDFSLTPE
jgi:tetratricopeptide (TPR) repeat protein